MIVARALVAVLASRGMKFGVARNGQCLIVGFLLASSCLLSIGPARAAVAPEIQAGSYVIRYMPSGTQERQGLLAAAGARVVSRLEQLRLANVLLDSDGLRRLKKSPLIQWIHKEDVSTIHGRRRPNDPLLSKQWALHKIHAFEGWAREDGTTGEPVVVAVADTGVDPSHPDLQRRLLPGFDFVNLDTDPADDHGHGTHVAGVIAAQPNNRTGIAGLSRASKILPLKACDVGGACSNFPVIESIVWAVEHGADVVNLSLGGPGDACPPEFDLAADFAKERGVLLVASAGNSGAKGGENPVTYPAACEGYVSVAASGPSDEWAPFSTHNQFVDLSAPGMQILSTLPPGLTMQDDPASHGYGPADGTSMASPHVAGLAALLLSAHPDWTPSQIQHRMEKTSLDLGKKGRDPFFGAGRIDVDAALGGRP